MIVGSKSHFAIDSYVRKWFDVPGIIAFGYFNVWVNGTRFGKPGRNAATLANSYYTVGERIANRGKHFADFCIINNVHYLARTICFSGWGDARHDRIRYCSNLSRDETSDIVRNNGLEWAPDGGDAFDGGYHILQMDIEDQVRIIAFRLTCEYKLADLTELWMPSDDFYGILSRWHQEFTRRYVPSAQRAATPAACLTAVPAHPSTQ